MFFPLPFLPSSLLGFCHCLLFLFYDIFLRARKYVCVCVSGCAHIILNKIRYYRVQSFRVLSLCFVNVRVKILYFLLHIYYIIILYLLYVRMIRTFFVTKLFFFLFISSLFPLLCIYDEATMFSFFFVIRPARKVRRRYNILSEANCVKERFFFHLSSWPIFFTLFPSNNYYRSYTLHTLMICLRPFICNILYFMVLFFPFSMFIHSNKNSCHSLRTSFLSCVFEFYSTSIVHHSHQRSRSTHLRNIIIYGQSIQDDGIVLSR